MHVCERKLKSSDDIASPCFVYILNRKYMCKKIDFPVLIISFILDNLVFKGIL